MVYDIIGRTYKRMGCLNEAVDAFRGGLERSPGHVGCAMNLARLLFQQGDVRGAIQELTRAAEENPDSMDINKFLVLLLAKEGDKDAARSI